MVVGGLRIRGKGGLGSTLELPMNGPEFLNCPFMNFILNCVLVSKWLDLLKVFMYHLLGHPGLPGLGHTSWAL